MVEITKDFIKFLAEIIVLLLIFSVVFGEDGIASNTYNYMVYAEPIMLQDYISSALTIGSQSPGEFSTSVKTSGQPYTIKIYNEEGIDYVFVEPTSEVYLRTKYAAIEPVPISSDCNVQETEVELSEGLKHTIVVRKVVENDGTCTVFLSIEGGTAYGTGSSFSTTSTSSPESKSSQTGSSSDSGSTTTSTCFDGTPYGQCSSTKPKYCEDGTLVDNCQQCGCASGTCQSDGSCQTITPPPTSATFTIHTDGSTYWAIRGSDGARVFESSEAHLTISDTLKAASPIPGAVVFLTEGLYIVSDTIQLQSGVSPSQPLVLDGTWDAIVKAGDGLGRPIFNAGGYYYGGVDTTPANNWVIRNIQIDGNRFNRTNVWRIDRTSIPTAEGILVERGRNFVIEHCYLHDHRVSAIQIGSWVEPDTVSDGVVRGNLIVDSDWNGITLGCAKDPQTTYRVNATGNLVINFDDVGIAFMGNTGEIRDNLILQDENWGTMMQAFTDITTTEGPQRPPDEYGRGDAHGRQGLDSESATGITMNDVWSNNIVDFSRMPLYATAIDGPSAGTSMYVVNSLSLSYYTSNHNYLNNTLIGNANTWTGHLVIGGSNLLFTGEVITNAPQGGAIRLGESGTTTNTVTIDDCYFINDNIGVYLESTSFSNTVKNSRFADCTTNIADYGTNNNIAENNVNIAPFTSITVSHSYGGTTTPYGTQFTNSLTATATPMPGYNFVYWFSNIPSINGTTAVTVNIPTLSTGVYYVWAWFEPKTTASTTSGYIDELIEGQPNIANNMADWIPTTWGGDPDLPNVWHWNVDNVKTPAGNPTWRGDPWTSANTNPHRELLEGFHMASNVGDLIVYRIWARSSAAIHDISYPTTMGLLMDYYPADFDAPNSSIGQVREHNSDARNAEGQYLCDVDPDWWSIDDMNENSINCRLPVNTIASHPETDGWVQLQITGIMPKWNPDLIDYYGNQGAYEILTYYGGGWSPVQPVNFAPDFIGAWFATDQGCTIWLGDAEVYVIPAGEYDPALIDGKIANGS